MTDLDLLARKSADALRGASAERDVPALRPSPDRTIVAATCLAAVILAVGFFGWRADSSTPDIAVGPAPEFDPDLRFEWPEAEGLEVTALGNGELRMTPNVGETVLYGDPDLDWPFAEDDLVVSTFATEAPQLGTGAVEVEVRGRAGWFTDDLPGWTPFGRTISWFEQPGVWIDVSSRTRSFEQLLEVAEDLEVDEMRARAVDAGLSEVALRQGPAVGGGREVPQIDLWYGTPDDLRAIVLWIRPNTGDELLFQRYLRAEGETTATTIRGTDGWVSTSRFEGSGDVALWVEDGWIVQLTVDDGFDLLEVAEELRPVSLARWEEMLAS